MSIFSEIEKKIERGFRHWTELAFGRANSDQLLLVHRAILEEIETRIQVLPRGKRVFPYRHLTVTLVSADAAQRELFQAAFGERVGADIREALAASGCDVPHRLAVEVRTADEGPQPFQIAYGTEPPLVESAGPGRLIVIRGKAEHEEYALDKPRVNIGRLAELTDSEQRVIRRNDVVFEEGAADVNGTVSRKHAHIQHEGSEYRVCDDGSEFGTRVFRDGRSIEVPSGDRRGEKLRRGDEIYLGRACLRFETDSQLR